MKPLTIFKQYACALSVFGKSFCTRIQYICTCSADCMSWLMPWQIIFFSCVAETGVIVQALCCFPLGFLLVEDRARSVVRHETVGWCLTGNSSVGLGCHAHAFCHFTWSGVCPSRSLCSAFFISCGHFSQSKLQDSQIRPEYWNIMSIRLLPILQHSSFHTASAHRQNVQTHIFLFVRLEEGYASPHCPFSLLGVSCVFHCFVVFPYLISFPAKFCVPVIFQESSRYATCWSMAVQMMEHTVCLTK
jgi:hypothetical protein